MRNDVRSTRTRSVREVGDSGRFVGNEDDSETWTQWTETPERRKGRREICLPVSLEPGLYFVITGALSRRVYPRSAWYRPRPKPKLKPYREKDVTEKTLRHSREVLTRVITDASLLSLPRWIRLARANFVRRDDVEKKMKFPHDCADAVIFITLNISKMWNFIF